MDKFDFVIVGAGFAGAVCAERLASAGKTVLLIDQRAHVGGNAYDYYDEAGILVHKYGAHVFHTNSSDVVAYLSQFTEWRPYEHRVLSSVNGELLPVPINRKTLSAFGGDEQAAKAAMVTPYTQKQWGSYASELSATVLARIKTRDSDDDRYFTDRFQMMPRHGYTRLFERMLAHPNVKVLLKTNGRDFLSWLRSRVAGRPEVIFTGPIDEYFDYRLGRLPYRSATFEFETTEGVLRPAQRQPVGVVNYPNEVVPYTRIAEFKHLTGQRHMSTTVAYEFPSATGEPFWPVPTAASAALYKEYEALAADTPDVHFVGRLGTYRYYDMDQVIAQALTLSARLLSGEQHYAHARAV